MQIPGSRRKRPVDGPAPSTAQSMPSSSFPGGNAGKVAAAGGVVVAMFLAAIGGSGSAIFTQTVAFLDFGAGVLALVSLTVAVVWGVGATDRMVLKRNHRLLAQAVHRSMAVAGIAFLGLHIWVKVSLGKASAIAPILPFTDSSRAFLVGLGTIAGYLFVAVVITGAMRSVFSTDVKRARSWRILHAMCYPAWGAALVHGLQTGRPADIYVTSAYAGCVIGVAIILVLRKNAKATASVGSKGVQAPRAPMKDVPTPMLKNDPALPPKPSQNPVGRLERGGGRLRSGAQEPWTIPAQASGEPDLPWSSREGGGRPRGRQADSDLPWSATTGAGQSAALRQEPQPSRPVYADPPTTQWNTGPLTSQTPPATGAVPGGSMPAGTAGGGVGGTGGGAPGAEWPQPAGPSSPEPVGAPWPRSTADPGTTNAPTAPWPGTAAPQPAPGTAPGAASTGSPWSSAARPPVGEPWVPTPDPSQTGRRVNGRTQ